MDNVKREKAAIEDADVDKIVDKKLTSNADIEILADWAEQILLDQGK